MSARASGWAPRHPSGTVPLLIDRTQSLLESFREGPANRMASPTAFIDVVSVGSAAELLE